MSQKYALFVYIYNSELQSYSTNLTYTSENKPKETEQEKEMRQIMEHRDRIFRKRTSSQANVNLSVSNDYSNIKLLISNFIIR